jgi:hypothetical protein
MNFDLTINKTLAEKVKEVSTQLNLGENDLIVKAIKRFLHAQEIALIRKEFKGVAKKKGYQTEQDIFNDIS